MYIGLIGVALLTLPLMASICDELEATLNVASYNSKGFSSSDNRVQIINELLAYKNMVVFFKNIAS